LIALTALLNVAVAVEEAVPLGAMHQVVAVVVEADVAHVVELQFVNLALRKQIVP
jgi:hypothetical protein